MASKSWQRFNKDVSWSTKIYVLVAILIGIGSFVFQAWSTNWALTIVAALAVILLVEHLWVVSRRHPKSWQTVKWTFLLLLIALLLLGLG